MRLNLVEIAFLPEETRSKLTSDFRIVADYFCAVREGKEAEFMKDRRSFRHVREMLEFFRVFTHDERYEKYIDVAIMQSEKGEPISMFKMLDYAENNGIAKGRTEGRTELLMSLISKKLNRGMSLEQIAREVEEDLPVILEIVEKLQTKSDESSIA